MYYRVETDCLVQMQLNAETESEDGMCENPLKLTPEDWKRSF